MDPDTQREPSPEAVRLVRHLGHDLNNLFSIVLGGLTLLRDDIDPGAWNAESLELHEDIQSATREAAMVIAKLTAWAGRQALSPRVTDLGALVREVAPRLAAPLPDGLELEHDTASDPAWAWVDREHLAEALAELVSNASEATAPDGSGHVRIEVEGGTRPAVSVVDEGQGMDAAALSRCREPYFTTRAGQGRRGLGLSAVDGFARASAGRLELRSAPGEGTRATLRLACPPAR